MILLTGATGFVGRHVCQALTERGHTVKILVRPRHGRPAVRKARVVPVTGDLRDAKSLVAALHDVRTVIHVASVVAPRDPAEFLTVNVEGTRRLVQVSGHAGVRRFIYMSSAAVLLPPSPYGDSKREAEAAVLEAGLDSTILRPAQIYGPGDVTGLGRLARMLRRLPILPIPGQGSYTLQPVHVQDVVGFVIAILDQAHSYRKTYTLAGPTPIPFRMIVTTMQSQLGLRRWIWPIPLQAIRWLARCQEKVLRHPLLSSDQVARITASTDFDISEAVGDFQFTPRPLEQGLRETFVAEGWIG